MRYKRTWQGDIAAAPADPDLVLGRHLRWSRPVNSEYSTLNGDEPDSITCASVWPGRIPDIAISSEATIYKDPICGLWIQAVPWRLVNNEQAQAWCDVQASLGAGATWINIGSRPHRPVKTMAEQELSKINSTEITYVDLITERGLLQFGDLDFTVMVPRARSRNVEYEHPIYHEAGEEQPQRRLRISNESSSNKLWKPVSTPLGVFRTVREASIAHKITSPGITARIRRDPDYKFITMEEYLEVKNSISKNSQGEDFQTTGVNCLST